MESKKKAKGEKTPINAKAKEKKLLSSIRSFVIVLALSIHSIFEGMAIGKPSQFMIFKYKLKDHSHYYASVVSTLSNLSFRN